MGRTKRVRLATHPTRGVVVSHESVGDAHERLEALEIELPTFANLGMQLDVVPIRRALHSHHDS